jgi:hypothetical protein
MTEDFDKMEREIDEALASLADDLSLEPPVAVTRRIKVAVQHELNEAWLADHPSPGPSPEAIRHVRMEIDAELRRIRRFRRLRGWSAVAAAAVIAVCVGIFQYVYVSRDISPAKSDVDYFTKDKEVFVDDSYIALIRSSFQSIRLDLEEIEDGINQYDFSEGYEQEALDELGNEIDTLFAEPELDWMS